MSRLITFGCSYTYGEGLPDVKRIPIIDQPSSPSKLGWASLLSQNLGLELVNMGYPGSSNTEILYNILTFDFKEDDTVIIMWTHPVRDIVFDKWTPITFMRTRLGFWKKETNKSWEEKVNIKDYIIKTWMCIHHADLFLTSRKLKYIHYPQDITEIETHRINEIKINNLYTHGFYKIDKVPDGHPGIKSNVATAQQLYDIIKQQ